MAIQAGADMLGLVSAMPSGPGVIAESEIRGIIESVAGQVETVLLTALTSASEIVAQHARCPASTIQLVDALNIADYSKLRGELDDVRLIQVVHVTGAEVVAQAVQVSKHVDAVLLDSGNPQLDVKELGGTGRTHDWSSSRKIVEQSASPVFLAGGLNPENVRAAIDQVRPAGVDVCSGVRADGLLNRKLLQHFIAAVRAG